MIHALMSGTLTAEPIERTTAKGAPFVTVSLRVAAGPESIFVGCVAFETAAAERLIKLARGAAVAVAGEMQLNVWTDREGQERRDWRLVAAEVMSIAQARRRRAAVDDRADDEGR